MKKEGRTLLEPHKYKKVFAALDDMFTQQKEATEVLDIQAKKVEGIDKKITYHEEKIKELEKEKQKELDKMHEFFDLAVTNSHKLSNGYQIKVHGKRPMTITDTALFLKWLKNNFSPIEVMEFFNEALKSNSIKNFVERYFDDERLRGNLNPKVEGVDVEAINYRRLITSYVKGDK